MLFAWCLSVFRYLKPKDSYERLSSPDASIKSHFCSHFARLSGISCGRFLFSPSVSRRGSCEKSSPVELAFISVGTSAGVSSCAASTVLKVVLL